MAGVTKTGAFVLYRFFASDDALLYVGLTINPGKRMQKHAADKPWWSDVARISMEQHGSLEELRAAERAAIVSEKPLHNIRMNGGRKAEPSQTTSGLVGRWFHSYVPVEEDQDTIFLTLDGNGNKREWQGQIVDRDGDVFIVQLYSWWDGFASDQKLVELREMKSWKFYETNESMRIADGCGDARGRDLPCRNPCTHVIRDWHQMGAIYKCSECIRSYSGKVEEL